MIRRRPRWESFDYIGRYRYFLTFCTCGKARHFTSPEHVECVASQILRTAGESCFNITAYVFMPDHLHLLVEGTMDQCNLRQFVSLAKQRSAYGFKQHYKLPLWQPSFSDHVLREEESSLPFIRYIIENPLRQNLVDRPEDYPYLRTGAEPVAEMIRMLDEAGIRVWDPVGSH